MVLNPKLIIADVRSTLELINGAAPYSSSQVKTVLWTGPVIQFAPEDAPLIAIRPISSTSQHKTASTIRKTMNIMLHALVRGSDETDAMNKMFDLELDVMHALNIDIGRGQTGAEQHAAFTLISDVEYEEYTPDNKIASFTMVIQAIYHRSVSLA